MAAITTLQVESVESTENDLLWTDPNSAQVPTVRRSTDNFVASDDLIATLAAATANYEDTTAVAGTRYWYKVHQTAGDSNVVNVVTQVCSVVGAKPNFIMQLGQMSDPITADQLNQLINSLDIALNGGNVSEATPCTLCPSNGAIVLDCTKCTSWTVEMLSDINSISMVGCSQGDQPGDLDFIVPPSGTPNISGFPKGFGNDPGKVPLTGGTLGATYGVGHSKKPGGPTAKPGTGGGSGRGGGGGGGGSLTLTCQTPTGGTNTNCSIDCVTLKKLRVVASGGILPYVFTVTGGLTLTAIDYKTDDVTPPANTGGAVAGVAYTTNWEACASFIRGKYQGQFSCADVAGTCGSTGSCTGGASGCATVGPVGSTGCTGLVHCEGTAAATCSGYAKAITGASENCCTSSGMLGAKLTCDTRTAGMIAAGCGPCGSTSAGKVVTVTDGAGTSVSKTITI